MSPRLYLNFHGLGAPHAGVDDGERPYWLSAARFEAILAAAAARGGEIGITFDDGNLSDLSTAAPALRRLGLTADFFIPVDRIGSAHYLSADDIRALHDAGMGVGSHGCAHVRWSELDDATLEDEVSRPLAVLSDIVGAKVDTVGVPFGAYDSRVLRVLRRHNVRRIFTSDGGPCLPGAWIVPRNSMRSDTPEPALQAMLSGSKHPARFYARAAKRVTRRMLSQFG
ncbi:MAG: polysaccharide deacetylase family protein [Hyphomonadaceae bacterium]